MKRFISIILSLILIFCLSVPMFADEKTDKQMIEDFALNFIKGEGGKPLLDSEQNTDNFTAVAYPLEENTSEWYAIVYDGETFEHDFFINANNGNPYIVISGGVLSMDEGLKLLKESTGAADEDIKLAFTFEGAYASVFDDETEMYRVGHKPVYGDVEQQLVSKTYTLTELLEAKTKMVEYLDAHPELGDEMGGINLSIDDFIEPAFPTWGYFAIGGAVLVLLSVLFIVKSKKKAKNN